MENCDKIAKASYDPGWNDPPKLSYNAHKPTPGRPRNFLNKRVAFPLSGPNTGLVSGPVPPVYTPLIPTMVSPMPVKTIHSVTDDTNIENIDGESALAETKTILLEFLENNLCTLGPTTDANDIKKRISVMEDMWSSGKLNKQVQALMKDLAIAIKEDQPSKADDLHRALMVDHVSMVGTWMPGIKRLIHHSITRSELLAIDKEETEASE